MLKIKLARTGTKNHPSYRIVVARDRSKLTGSPVETLGYYKPEEKRLQFEKALVDKWLSKGVTPTDSVKKLLKL